jgi:hypothetical protein
MVINLLHVVRIEHKALCVTAPSPLRERVGMRVKGPKITPPHLASPPQGGEVFWA